MKRKAVMLILPLLVAGMLSSCVCGTRTVTEPVVEPLPAAIKHDAPPPKVLNGNPDLYSPVGRTTQVSRKLARGLGNTFFFWAEIPKNMFRKGYSTYPWAGFWYGLNRGIEQGSQRFVYGLLETFTFFAPCHRDYEPYLLPEFVLMDEPDIC